MSMRNSPSGNCCTPKCVVFAPSDITSLDQITVLAGSYAYNTDDGINGYQSTDSVSAFALNTPVSAGLPRRITMWFLHTGAGTSSWQLAVCASDSANYNFIEPFITKVGSDFFLRARLGKVRAGVVTYLGSAPYSATVLQITSTGSHIIRAYVDWDEDGNLSGAATDVPGVGSSATAGILTARGVDSPGEFAGLFVTGLNGTLKAYNIQHEHLRSATTQHCASSQLSCAESLAEQSFLVKITDSTPASFTYPGSGPTNIPCGWNCSSFPGTYTVNMFDTLSLVSGQYVINNSKIGDQTCSWIALIFNESYRECATGFGFDVHIYSDIYLQVSLESHVNAGIRVIITLWEHWRLYYSHVPGVLQAAGTVELARFDEEGIAPQSEWDDWINIPKAVSDSPGRCNTSSNITAEIKKV